MVTPSPQCTDPVPPISNSWCSPWSVVTATTMIEESYSKTMQTTYVVLCVLEVLFPSFSCFVFKPYFLPVLSITIHVSRTSLRCTPDPRLAPHHPQECFRRAGSVRWPGGPSPRLAGACRTFADETNTGGQYSVREYRYSRVHRY